MKTHLVSPLINHLLLQIFLFSNLRAAPCGVAIVAPVGRRSAEPTNSSHQRNSFSTP
jgi:hypothetical protein